MLKEIPTQINTVLIATRDSINVRLSQDELHDRAMQSIRVYGELETAQHVFKDVQKEWKKSVAVIETRYNNLRRTVESGEEFREVDCQRAFDVAKGTTWLVFDGKKYLERPCSADELELARQGNIFDA